MNRTIRSRQTSYPGMALAIALLWGICAFPAPGEELGLCVQAQAAKSAGRIDEAINLYLRCIEEGDLSARNRSVAHNNVGNIYLGLERYNYAIDHFNHAIELFPQYSKPYNNRGIAFQQKGLYRFAIADYAKSIELNPDHINAYNNLAWLRATCPIDELRDGKEAVQLAERVNRMTDWQEGSYLDTLAAAHAEAGDFDVAVKYARMALEFSAAEEHASVQERLELYLSRHPWREVTRRGAPVP